MKIGYARVSTRDQNHELQISALEKEGCEKIFIETASGSLNERPELAKMMEFVREGDTVVVWKIDRLGRSTSHLIATIDDLGKRSIDFKCLTAPVDTTTPGGRMLFTMFGVFAEFELAMNRERTRAGIENARRNGKAIGRPHKMNSEKLDEAYRLLRMRDALGKPVHRTRDVAKIVDVSFSLLNTYFVNRKPKRLGHQATSPHTH